MGKKQPKAPKSFNFHLIQGERLSYTRGGTVTPTCAYHFVGTPVQLTDSILLEWFQQTLTPLIGADALKELEKLLKFEPNEVNHTAKYDSFLAKMKHFREQQK
jgi:hypothetical protein